MLNTPKLQDPKTEYKYRGLKNVRVFTDVDQVGNREGDVVDTSNISWALNVEIDKLEQNPSQFFGVTSNLFTGNFVKIKMRDLQGRLLSLLEATIRDEAQLNATKDVARSMFKDKQNEIDQLSMCDWQA
jgi:hypothetical protein